MTITLNGTTGIVGPNGTASVPAMTGVDTDSGIVYGTNTVQIATGGATAVTVDSSQNVGIGTNSPTEKLSVTGNIALTGGISLQSNQGPYWGGGTAYIAYNTSTNTMQFGTNSLPNRVNIDSSGNLLLGCTTSRTGNSSLSFEAGNSGIFFRQTGTGAFTQVLFTRATDTTPSTAGFISTTGTTTSYVTTSDYRLKENVAPMTGALAKVSALKPVTYTWKADSSEGQGFIAHELQAIVPDCVTGEKDAVDAEGNPVYQGIDTSFLVATLTAAIQELNAKVTALEAQLGAK